MNMPSHRPRRAQQGGALVATALLTPLLAALLLVPLFFGQVVWHYSLAHKAAQDAARFLSTATPGELRMLGDAGAGALGRATQEAEATALLPVTVSRSVRIQCGTTIAQVTRYSPCGQALPETVRVTIELSVRENLFPAAWAQYRAYGAEGVRLQTFATMRYAGH